MYSDLHEKNSSQMPLNNAHLLFNHHYECKWSLLAMKQTWQLTHRSYLSFASKQTIILF